MRIDAGSHWRNPGDRARIVVRLLGRPVELEMTLHRLAPYRVVEYTSVQCGLPDAHHERHFETPTATWPTGSSSCIAPAQAGAECSIAS
jgi:hypothetical protein